MVRCDLKANRRMGGKVDEHGGPRAPNGFRQGRRCASVQQAQGLNGPVVHGQGGAEPSIGIHMEPDAQALQERSRHQGVGQIGVLLREWHVGQS